MGDFLEAAEESELLRSEDSRARNRVVCAHLPIAKRLARLFASSRCDAEELRAVGALALVEAALRFDPERGQRFGPYASVAVQRAIVRHLAKNGHSVLQIPERVWDQIRKARDLGQCDEASRRLIALGTPGLSLNMKLPNGGELVDLLPSGGEIDGVVEVVVTSLRDFDVSEVLSRLNSGQSREIVELVFGLGGDRPRTYAEVAEILGVSVSTVSRLLGVALAQLRHPLRSALVREYAED